jgi:hypothetical protein
MNESIGPRARFEVHFLTHIKLCKKKNLTVVELLKKPARRHRAEARRACNSNVTIEGLSLNIVRCCLKVVLKNLWKTNDFEIL